MINNLSLLLSFLRLFIICEDAPKTLTFETSLISLSMKTGVFQSQLLLNELRTNKQLRQK